MNERIKKLRKALDLTQQAFADRIGIRQNTVAKYETNRGTPTTSVISLIVREFNVSEKWLRTGEGEMFNQSVENTVDRLCAELHASELESGIIRAYFRIDPRIREPFMQRMIQEMQSEYAALAPVSAESEQSEPVQPVEQKTPPPVSESGLDDTEKLLTLCTENMDPVQKRMFLEHWRKLSKQQKESSTASDPLATDDKSPESERPDWS
ncbi:MAG: helix-turn-helix transcriptional regulator [Oscillospiraceae bacterium]|nr:helix-turn-helix transcriptional regulator [Oscillospiraceae bacterium]